MEGATAHWSAVPCATATGQCRSVSACRRWQKPETAVGAAGVGLTRPRRRPRSGGGRNCALKPVSHVGRYVDGRATVAVRRLSGTDRHPRVRAGEGTRERAEVAHMLARRAGTSPLKGHHYSQVARQAGPGRDGTVAHPARHALCVCVRRRRRNRRCLRRLRPALCVTPVHSGRRTGLMFPEMCRVTVPDSSEMNQRRRRVVVW